MKLFSKSEILQKIKSFLASHPDGVIEILGPTASGKSDFAIEITKSLANAEIISVDSRQVYRDIDISAAKVSDEEMQEVPHHGIDLIDPETDFSVYNFQQYAFQTIAEIQERKNTPILCGGTMLWLDAVSENYIFADQKDEKSTKKGTPKFPVLKIGIHWDRAILYDRINQRAVKQFESGLIEETKEILQKYKITKSAFTSFGYQEIKDHLDEKITYEEALTANQKRNRNYAKRQLTWWRGREDVVWVEGASINS